MKKFINSLFFLGILLFTAGCATPKPTNIGFQHVVLASWDAPDDNAPRIFSVPEGRMWFIQVPEGRLEIRDYETGKEVGTLAFGNPKVYSKMVIYWEILLHGQSTKSAYFDFTASRSGGILVTSRKVFTAHPISRSRSGRAVLTGFQFQILDPNLPLSQGDIHWMVAFTAAPDGTLWMPVHATDIKNVTVGQWLNEGK